jgi:hypothetical protein
MPVNVIAFSQFTNGGTLVEGDIVVGLADGTNAQFTTANASGFSWGTVTTSTNMVTNAGYITNSGSLITLTLPTVSSVGDYLSVVDLGGALWQIAQNAGQSIIVAPQVSTQGATGYLASNFSYCSMTLVCVIANLTWSMLGSPQGTLTIN